MVRHINAGYLSVISRSLSMFADNYSHSGGAGAVLVMSLSVKAAPLVRTNRFAPPRSVIFIEAVQIP